MPPRITDVQRQAVLQMLAQGMDRQSIADQVGLTPGQVSAVAAHVKMGTYALPSTEGGTKNSPVPTVAAGVNLAERVLVKSSLVPAEDSTGAVRIYLGRDAESDTEVFWSPHPDHGSANPHVLVIGESGFGKTYAISALLIELSRQGVPSVVIDYGQGFSLETAPDAFVRQVRPTEIHASRDGIALNPLQVFPSDLHGPVNVAQRIADTFCRVYSKLGIQQHAVLRGAVLDVFEDAGIRADAPASWTQPPPPFAALQQKLAEYGEDRLTPRGRTAATVASHISTIFVFNTFRPSGRHLSWETMVGSGGAFVIQLKGLEDSLERAATELLLWNLIGFLEALGPGPLRCFVVLDEAHRLSFAPGSPVEKLLREGRKFGVGLILASQQPEDFSTVAFANTATKLVFQVSDENGVVSRQLHRKIRNSHSLVDIAGLITRLPRGRAYVVTNNTGRVVRIASFEERGGRTPHTSSDE